MKKLILVLLVVSIAVTSAFASFDKSNLNINIRPVGLTAQYGLSYDYGKWEFGVEYVPLVSPTLLAVYFIEPSGDTLEQILLGLVSPAGALAFANYEVASWKKCDLNIGASAGLYGTNSALGPGFPFGVGFNTEFAYHFNDNNSINARLVVSIYPGIPYVIETSDIGFLGVLSLYQSSIGYTYSF